MRNNFLFLFAVPIYMIISMVLAVIIDRHVYLKSYFKVAYFMPYASSIVAVAVVWYLSNLLDELARRAGKRHVPHNHDAYMRGRQLHI